MTEQLLADLDEEDPPNAADDSSAEAVAMDQDNSNKVWTCIHIIGVNIGRNNVNINFM